MLKLITGKYCDYYNACVKKQALKSHKEGFQAYGRMVEFWARYVKFTSSLVIPFFMSSETRKPETTT